MMATKNQLSEGNAIFCIPCSVSSVKLNWIALIWAGTKLRFKVSKLIILLFC